MLQLTSLAQVLTKKGKSWRFEIYSGRTWPASGLPNNAAWPSPLRGSLSSLKFGCGSIARGYWNRSCIESEKQALLLLRKSLVDDSNYLSSWVGDNCCTWHGIGCNNGTGHITQLDPQNGDLRGELPHCLRNLTMLSYLDVMNNSLSGYIPVSLGSLGYLVYLNLHNNKFQGKLPLSFQNLTEIVALDVGKNNLSDILPSWTGKQLPNLRYLVLRSNNFYGNIPTQLCYHSSIQVLNLAQNQITGSIPPCFGNLSVIKSGRNDSVITRPGSPYLGISSDDGEAVIDDAKGYELQYTSTLEFLFSIDLSKNNISGEIPEELMDLRGLLNLNLAGNHLVGKIPDEIGKLENLEYLDLCTNQLSGDIPQSLSDLNFLRRLNLSFNDLSGRIPTGNQLQTLRDPSIYAGNSQLCGQPILKPCAGDTESHNVQDNKEADSDLNDERMWFYAGIGPGLLVVFLRFCASLHFIRSWRYYYFHIVEQIIDEIAVYIALLWRKFHN